MSILNILQAGTAAAADTANQAAAATGVSAAEQKSIMELIHESGSYPILVPLAILSLVSIYIIVEKWMSIRKVTKQEQNFLPRIKEYLKDGKLEAARSLCDSTNSPTAKMVGKGLSQVGRKSTKDIAANIENEGKLEIYKLDKKLSFLATTSGAAPMIGFLGTTIGMIQVFNDIQNQTQIEIATIAPGIMNAMITTVAGLVVGILAYVSYNGLVSRVESVVHRMESSAIAFLDILDEPAK